MPEDDSILNGAEKSGIGAAMRSGSDNNRRPIRPATARLTARLLAPLLDSGLVTADELAAIRNALTALTKADPTPPVAPKLIRPQEAAELLSVSYSQFRALEKEGAFPFRRRLVGNKTVRYLNVEVISYMIDGALPEGPADPAI